MSSPTKLLLSFVSIALMASQYVNAAGIKVTKVGDSVVDPETLTFKSNKLKGEALKKAKGTTINGKSNDSMASHGGYQYVGYYDGKRQVCIARRKLPAGQWEIIRFTDYLWKLNDPHNHVVIGICPGDGTIHMAFDHHVHPLHYRVSKKGAATKPEATKWKASLFGPVISKLHGDKPGKITYPHFWQTPAGGLQFFWRKGYPGKGWSMLADYGPKTGTWSNIREVTSPEGVFKDFKGIRADRVKSRSRYSYMKGFSYGPDGTLHTSWVWREHPGRMPNHDFMYAYSKDGGNTWLNNAGRKLKGAARVDSPGITVVKIPDGRGLANDGNQTVDSQGRVHVLLRYNADTTRKGRQTVHTWRDKNGKWEQREIPFSGRFLIDKKDNAYIIRASTKGLEIAAATAASRWTDWKDIHTEKGQFHNRVAHDEYRLKKDGILSVMVQQTAPKISAADAKDLRHGGSTPLRVLDFTFEQE